MKKYGPWPARTGLDKFGMPFVETYPMSEPTTEAGRELLSAMTALGLRSPGTDNSTGQRLILAIEDEVLATLRDRWEDAKRTKLSTVHDVGGAVRVVDALFGVERASDG